MTKTITIEGMMCGMCESHVADAIRNAFSDVKKVTVSHKKGTAVISGATLPTNEAIRKVIDATGYRFVSAVDETAGSGRAAKPDYKNWVPKGMVYGFVAATIVTAILFVVLLIVLRDSSQTMRIIVGIVTGLLFFACAMMMKWCIVAYNKFSYDGSRKLSRQIIDGTAQYVSLPRGGKGLDVGCGSGALTIACAKRNPQASFLGIDRWGKEYASFSKGLCESNSVAEGVSNTEFRKGDATKLDFPDETFDAVVSNYVYHNIGGYNKQALLRESLRVLKKGGTFAIHDIMSKGRYGDMQKFAAELRAEGYENVQLIPTDNGMFMSRIESMRLMLRGSTLLVGKK